MEEWFLLEQDVLVGQATISERPVCRGMCGSCFPPDFSSHQGHVAQRRVGLMNLKPGTVMLGSVTVCQWAVLSLPPYLGGSNIQKALLPCLSAEGLGPKS